LGNVSFLKEKFPAIYQHFAPGAKQAFDELILFLGIVEFGLISGYPPYPGSI